MQNIATFKNGEHSLLSRAEGVWTAAVLTSGVVHILLMGVLSTLRPPLTHVEKKPMQVTLSEKKKVAMTPPKPKEIPKKTLIPVRKVVTPKPVAKVTPVAGLSKESFADNSKAAMVAPAGNTSMTADKGIRLRPDQISGLNQDLSADAKLIGSSVVKPKYTADALDAGFEGRVAIDVYVDESGHVASAELPRKVGYQMDQRIIDMAMAAQFVPRQDPHGNSMAGWTQIFVVFTIE